MCLFMRSTQDPLICIPETSSAGVKLQECEAYRSHVSGSELKIRDIFIYSSIYGSNFDISDYTASNRRMTNY
jgi:hypothetical protein